MTVLLCEDDAECFEVGPGTVWVSRLRENHVSEVKVPTEQDLCRGAAVSLRNGGDCRGGEKLAVAQRAPGTGDDAVAVVELA